TRPAAPAPADNGQQREETPAEPPPVKPAPVRPARPARARTVVEASGQMDKHERARWRTSLQNAARKLAADRARVLESEDAWVDTVTDARDAGVPANVILAAAADADVELPE
ncbi:MAG TPA: hypothetical protein VGN22_03610, partial [Pseudonocardia sp.]